MATWRTHLAVHCVLCCVVSLSAAEPPTVERLDDLSLTLAGAPAWSAAFDQEYLPVGMTVGERDAGVVRLAWPDRALFRTGDPPVRLMGLEGRTARLVDLEAETCDEHELSDHEWERFPLAALLDPESARDHFDVTEGSDGSLALVPFEPGGVQRVELRVGPDGLPSEVVVVDPQGAVNRLRFRSWRRVDAPPAGGWLPAAPAGVECVGDPGALD